MKALIIVSLLLAGCSKEYSSMHCNPDDIPNHISKNDVIKLCGNPTKINRSKFNNNIYEQLVYGLFGPYIYIDNDKYTGYN